jgi:hypothetical protein
MIVEYDMSVLDGEMVGDGQLVFFDAFGLSSTGCAKNRLEIGAEFLTKAVHVFVPKTL